MSEFIIVWARGHSISDAILSKCKMLLSLLICNYKSTLYCGIKLQHRVRYEWKQIAMLVHFRSTAVNI